MLSPKDAWQATLGQLQLQLNRPTFDTWLKGSEVLAYEDGEFTIRVRHAYAKDWLDKHLKTLVTQTLGSIVGRSVQVNFTVYLGQRQSTPAHSKPAPEILPDEAAGVSAPSPHDESLVVEADPLPLDEQTWASALPDDFPDFPDTSEWDPRDSDIRFDTGTGKARADLGPLTPHYTFETFVTGPGNQFACAAAQAVAGTAHTQYNPLVIHGRSGLGKTHLLHAIGHAARATGRRAIYVTAENFTNELIQAIRTHRTAEFREHYRSAEVLLIDDIQFVIGKASSEAELCHTLNAVFSRGGRIVLSSHSPLHALKGLDERLRSQLEGGLLADLQMPDQVTRRKIVAAKSAAQGSPLPDSAADLLARLPVSSVRELEGLLTQVIARATLGHEPLTVELVQRVIDRQPTTPPSQRPASLARVLQATARYHQLSLDDLTSKSRTKAIVRARHIAIYLAREQTEASLPQIGEALGGRNHSTVLHGYQKIVEQVEANEELRREVSAIRQQLLLFPDK